MDYLRTLNPLQIQALQNLLTMLGYPATADGILGPKTRQAWDAWQAAITDTSESGTILETQAAIRAACRTQGLTLPTQIAYVLATVQWETAGTFQPVREAFWCSEDWRRQNLRYYPYYGRGYVQITWQANYAKYAELLGIDLVTNPDLALHPGNAVFILTHGFAHGTFTGKKITDYITSFKTDFFNCRRCINRMDHARDIASMAEVFLCKEAALSLSEVDSITKLGESRC